MILGTILLAYFLGLLGVGLALAFGVEVAVAAVVLLVLAFVAAPLFKSAPQVNPRYGRGGGRSGQTPGSMPPRAVRVGSHHIPAIDWNPDWKWPER